MEQYHGASKTKRNGSGGTRRTNSDKHLNLVGRGFAAPKVVDKDEKHETKIIRIKGGNTKTKMKRVEFANVVTKDGIKKAKVTTVVESPENRHHARMNIITKGSILQTELGKVKVTSRPGQTGVVNGVLLS